MPKHDTRQKLLMVSTSGKDARQALREHIPSMTAGININTLRGDLRLTGDDAEAVMELVAALARRRIAKG